MNTNIGHFLNQKTLHKKCFNYNFYSILFRVIQHS